MSIIVTITGPTASGKTTLENLLVDRGLQRITSATTRPKRAGEVDGRDYHFLTASVFKSMRSFFICETVIDGHSYAVPRDALSSLLDRSDAVVVLEPTGAVALGQHARSLGHNALSVFLSHDPEILARRYLTRSMGKGATEEQMSRRLTRLFEREIRWEGMVNWDMVFEDFGLEGQAQTVDEIMRLVESMKREVA